MKEWTQECSICHQVKKVFYKRTLTDNAPYCKECFNTHIIERRDIENENKHMDDTIKQTNVNWLKEEEASLTKNSNYEKLETLKFEPNKIVEFDVNYSQPFGKWSQQNDKGKIVHKAIIPVVHNGVKKNWWLNMANPVYKQVVARGLKGQTKCKIIQTGTAADTKYTLVE